jgi:hypothetical protein
MIKLGCISLASLVALGLAPAGALERVPVPDPVRACPRYGPGFVQVPGSTTCIKLGGRVTSEYTTGTRHVSRDQIAGFGTSARVSMDTRTDTAYGPLRSYVRVRAGSNTGQDR